MNRPLQRRSKDLPPPWHPNSASGYITGGRSLFYHRNREGWGPELCARRPDVTPDTIDAFLDRMYLSNADFVFTVTCDFVRECRTPILVLPDDVPTHPYAVAMETVDLAPNAEVSIYPWKDSQDHIDEAVGHVRNFLSTHCPPR